jgi:hypothetical protein
MVPMRIKRCFQVEVHMMMVDERCAVGVRSIRVRAGSCRTLTAVRSGGLSALNIHPGQAE